MLSSYLALIAVDAVLHGPNLAVDAHRDAQRVHFAKTDPVAASARPPAAVVLVLLLAEDESVAREYDDVVAIYGSERKEWFVEFSNLF